MRYLAAAGREGQHYVEALELMNTVQAESLRDGVTGAAAQLPPDIMADKYLLQAEQAIREEDYEGARAAMEKILLLQAEHDLTLPDGVSLQVCAGGGPGELAGASTRIRREVSGDGGTRRRALCRGAGVDEHRCKRRRVVRGGTRKGISRRRHLSR